MYMANELIVFINAIIFGMGVGIFFDFFRIIRKSIPHYDILVTFQDFVFCILSGAYIFALIYFLNFGEIRIYILIGILISNILYFILISKYVTKVFFIILISIKHLFEKFYKMCKKIVKSLEKKQI